MTIRIGLCDDEIAELDKIEKLLNAYEQKNPGLDFMIQCFESADTLLTMFEEKKFVPELIFMDILMPGEEGERDSLGMKAAKKLQSMGSKAKLIFLTTSREYALEAFDVDAVGYLVKPVPQDKIFSILDKFLAETEQERKKYILLKNEGKLIKVSLNDVIYCEARGKRQCICLTDGMELFQSLTMTKIYEMFSIYREFVRVGASYIINLEHIDSLNAQELQLDNGQTIYLPRGAYPCLREQYFEYYCGKGSTTSL